VDDVIQLVRREDPRGLVIKPPDGQQGRGVLIYDDIDVTSFTARVQGGEIVDLYDEILRLGSGQLIQERLSQHHLLAEINPGTTNTVRVVTFISTAGQVRVPFAAARFGRMKSVVDNWDQGGVCVGVDPQTGVLQRGVLKPKHGGLWLDAHPDTGVEFRGRPLPMWEEVLDLCHRASGCLPGLRTIGWDVVITPTGPVILEANQEWDLIMVQVHTAGWLALPGVREDLAAYGIRLPREVPSLASTAGQIAGRKLTKLGRLLAARFDAYAPRRLA
jgi:hypothetical protein